MKTEPEIRAEIERARNAPASSSYGISHNISTVQALEWVLSLPIPAPLTDEQKAAERKRSEGYTTRNAEVAARHRSAK